MPRYGMSYYAGLLLDEGSEVLEVSIQIRGDFRRLHGDPEKTLGGVHTLCLDLLETDRIRILTHTSSV